MKIIQVIEFYAPGTLHKAVHNNINEWLEKNSNKEIIDIKYSIGPDYSGALVIYKDEVWKGEKK